MKTIFLAAGRSSRMKPIKDKNLLEFCGEPLILKLLKNAKKGGLRNFIVVCNEDNCETITKILNACFDKKVTVTIQPNLDEGMMGGIIAGLKLIDDEEDLFILGGNDYVEPEIYQAILDRSRDWDGGILCKKMTAYFPGGYIKKDAEGRILEIIEKPGEGNEPSDLVNIVGHHFRRAGDLKKYLSIADSKNDDVYEVALHNLFQDKQFLAVEYEGVWQAIKYPWHVLEMMEIFLNDPLSVNRDQYTEIQKNVWAHKSAQIADTARVRGENILIEEGAKIFDNAVILGPCYIGKNTLVGNNALVRNSILGENSTAGYNTEIARSFIAPNVTTHMAYVGDSVVESGVNFGAYSCTGNLRLDKKSVQVQIKGEKIDSHHKKFGAVVGCDAQIGIHACLMPGTKIPVGEFVMPSSVFKGTGR